MPTYAYKCAKCDHGFDRIKSVSSRKQPEGEPCPECGAEGSVSQQVVANRNSIVTGVGSSPPTSKVDNGFKDVLKTIKANSGKGCTIDV